MNMHGVRNNLLTQLKLQGPILSTSADKAEGHWLYFLYHVYSMANQHKSTWNGYFQSDKSNSSHLFDK